MRVNRLKKDVKNAQRLEKLRYWHKWFAWRPVKTTNNKFDRKSDHEEMAWLEVVGRRAVLGRRHTVYGRSDGNAAIMAWEYCKEKDVVVYALKMADELDMTDIEN